MDEQKTPKMIGDTMTFDKQKVELAIKKINTDTFWDVHWHEYFEIKMILNGSGYIVVNGEKYRFQKGCIYIIMPSSIHKFIPDGMVTIFNLTMRKNMLLDEEIIKKFSDIGELFFQLDKNEFDDIYSIFKMLEREMLYSCENSEMMKKNLIECLFIILKRKSRIPSGFYQQRSTNINAALSYIKIHFREEIKLGDVASVAGFNPSYFSLFFRKEMGVNFSGYITKLRLNYAKKLLCSGQYTINEIYKQSGFKTYSHFLKVFKKEYSYSPKEYKNRVKGE